MQKIQVQVKRLNIEIPLDVHCEIKKYVASKNISMTGYITAVLTGQIKRDVPYEQAK
jgi:hypothetical protein